MKNLSLLVPIIAVTVFLTACIPSINPLSQENETADTKIEGKWIMEETSYDVQLTGNFYTVTAKRKGGKEETFYKMILTPIENETYASITVDLSAPDIKNAINDAECFVFHLWRLYRLTVTEDEIRLYWPNEAAGNEMLKALGCKTLQKDSDQKDHFITSPPKEIKAWLAKNKTAYSEKMNTKNNRNDNRNYFTFKKVK